MPFYLNATCKNTFSPNDTHWWARFIFVKYPLTVGQIEFGHSLISGLFCWAPLAVP